MQVLVMACAVSSSETRPDVYTSAGQAAAAYEAELRTGTLLFSDGKCLAVKCVSWSQYTHVAAVVRDRGQLFVYDSQNGVGVRRLTLREYLAETAGEAVEIVQPEGVFGPRKAKGFRAFLESHLGRPYAIAHFLTGSRCEGVHCAEYLTGALMSVEVITAENPSRVSPASLREGLLSYDLYEKSGGLLVLAPQPERDASENWCRELWLDTKDCWRDCWGGVRGCVFCR